MSILTTKDFPSLTTDLQSLFNEVASRKIAENVGFTVFDISDTNRLDHKHQLYHGLVGIKKVAEGEDFPEIGGVEGDSITWTQEQYAGIVPVTKKMRLFELHDQIIRIATSVSEDAFNKVDQSLADRLVGGFTTTYTDPYGDTQSSLGPDGLSLFHTAHTSPSGSTNFSNLCVEGSTENVPLSRQAIVDTMVRAELSRDPNGIIRPVILDTLVVSPHLRDLAERLVLTQYLPGSANNDINPLYGRVKIKVWSRLALNSGNVDTKAYWFMMNESMAKAETLKALFAERPSLDAPEEVYENKTWKYSLDFFYVTGNGYPAYVYGSNASA